MSASNNYAESGDVDERLLLRLSAHVRNERARTESATIHSVLWSDVSCGSENEPSKNSDERKAISCFYFL